mmetsp:Transcript_25484/g.60628  ORF Transcript_25484/g.60628 Transcript_25484/m.60628 type:complete len:254 (+) Transcript_25484:2280-3041(+)
MAHPAAGLRPLQRWGVLQAHREPRRSGHGAADGHRARHQRRGPAVPGGHDVPPERRGQDRRHPLDAGRAPRRGRLRQGLRGPQSDDGGADGRQGASARHQQRHQRGGPEAAPRQPRARAVPLPAVPAQAHRGVHRGPHGLQGEHDVHIPGVRPRRQHRPHAGAVLGVQRGADAQLHAAAAARPRVPPRLQGHPPRSQGRQRARDPRRTGEARRLWRLQGVPRGDHHGRDEVDTRVGLLDGPRGDQGHRVRPPG